MKIVVERTNKRVISITPQQDGRVKVVAYRGLSQRDIANLIAENLSWISNKMNKLSGVDTRNAPITTRDDVAILSQADVANLFAGRTVLLCGQLYNVTSSAHSQSVIEGDCLYICEKYFADKALRQKAIKSFVKRSCQNFLSQEIAKFGSSIASCPQKIEFKDLKSRWCDCSQAENHVLILDYRAIQLPDALQRFLIAHVFCHFRYAGHDEDFYNHLSNYIPKYKDCQNKLKDYDFLFDI